MGIHTERSVTCPEEVGWSHSRQPENSGLEDRLIYQKMESSVRASICQIKELTYTFIQLFHRVEHLDNIDSERSGREDKSLLGNPQWMEGILDKG